MNTDYPSEEELEKLRRIWERPLETPQAPQGASAEIAESVAADVDQTMHLKIPEKKEDQIKALDLLTEAFKAVTDNMDKPSIRHLQEILNDPKIVKGLGDKVRVVVNFVAMRLSDLMEKGTSEALNAFRENVLSNVQMGLETARNMKEDITPMEIRILETLFNALKVPYSPIDVIRIFSEKDQQKTYELAFKTEEEDLDRELVRALLHARAVLRKCKEEKVDKETIKTAEEEVAYLQSLAHIEPFPQERKKRLDEFYRFKTQLRNWELVMKGEISYEEMLKLYEKLKPKKEKNDEANA